MGFAICVHAHAETDPKSVVLAIVQSFVFLPNLFWVNTDLNPSFEALSSRLSRASVCLFVCCGKKQREFLLLTALTSQLYRRFRTSARYAGKVWTTYAVQNKLESVIELRTCSELEEEEETKFHSCWTEG